MALNAVPEVVNTERLSSHAPCAKPSSLHPDDMVAAGLFEIY